MLFRSYHEGVDVMATRSDWPADLGQERRYRATSQKTLQVSGMPRNEKTETEMKLVGMVYCYWACGVSGTRLYNEGHDTRCLAEGSNNPSSGSANAPQSRLPTNRTRRTTA